MGLLSALLLRYKTKRARFFCLFSISKPDGSTLPPHHCRHEHASEASVRSLTGPTGQH